MKLLSIASGSSGNCIYVGNDETHLLIDAGISGVKVDEGLEHLQIRGEDLSGVLITHEHSDHIKGLGVLARKYHVPIYATEGTIREIMKCRSLGSISYELVRPIQADRPFCIDGITVSPIRTSHDAADPVAYRCDDESGSVAVITDLGVYDDYIVQHLLDLDAILIESNHDVCMLEVGKYPYPLKQRILSERGHLSNEWCGRLLCRIMSDRLKYVMLGHLSKENNMPELAYETVKLELRYGLGDDIADRLPLEVAGREECSSLIRI